MFAPSFKQTAADASLELTEHTYDFRRGLITAKTNRPAAESALFATVN